VFQAIFTFLSNSSDAVAEHLFLQMKDYLFALVEMPNVAGVGKLNVIIAANCCSAHSWTFV